MLGGKVKLKVCMLVLATILFTGCGTQNETKVIKMAHGLDVKHPVHQSMVHMAERLAQLSAGSMRVDIYPSGQLGSERELIELLQIGSLGMTKVSASPLEGFVPQMKVFSLPYLFEDNDHFWRVLKTHVGKSLLLAGQPFLIRGLGYYDAGSRSFYSTKKQVKSPSDLSGMKIRVMNSQTAVEMINVMGGSATPVSFGELYTALQQGVVDGAENNPPSFHLSRHYEVSKYYTIDEHTSIPDVILISKYVWDSLDQQQQQWLQQATDESVDFQRKLWKRATKEAMSVVKEAGVEVLYPDKSQFLDSVADVYKGETNEAVKEMVLKIEAMRSSNE